MAKQPGDGHNWSMMQFLSRVDQEYSCLVNLNQWNSKDLNSTIVAHRAELSNLKLTLQAQAQERTYYIWTAKADTLLDSKGWGYY